MEVEHAVEAVFDVSTNETHRAKKSRGTFRVYEGNNFFHNFRA
jgi:hypothetical protein